MLSGSPARWLAPLALCAAFLAVVLVVTTSTSDESDRPAAATETGATDTQARTSTDRAGTSPRTSTTPTTSTTTTTPATGEKTYRVEPGDTLGTIAEETGLSVSELQGLNPGVDSQALTVGQEIKLVP